MRRKAMKMRERFHRWVATVRRRLFAGPPLVGLESLEVITEDMRKLGIGAMGAGVLGFFAPSEKITVGASVALLFVGAIIWLTGIALHVYIERERSVSKD